MSDQLNYIPQEEKDFEKIIEEFNKKGYNFIRSDIETNLFLSDKGIELYKESPTKLIEDMINSAKKYVKNNKYSSQEYIFGNLHSINNAWDTVKEFTNEDINVYFSSNTFTRKLLASAFNDLVIKGEIFEIDAAKAFCYSNEWKSLRLQPIDDIIDKLWENTVEEIKKSPQNGTKTIYDFLHNKDTFFQNIEPITYKYLAEKIINNEENKIKKLIDLHDNEKDSYKNINKLQSELIYNELKETNNFTEEELKNVRIKLENGNSLTKIMLDYVMSEHKELYKSLNNIQNNFEKEIENRKITDKSFEDIISNIDR